LFGAASGSQDFTAIVGFDYSSVTYPISVPPAPHTTNGTTTGLYITANKDATGAVAAVNVFPTNTFSGDFAVKFDLWINWTNLATSTEQVLFGINHSGTIMNRIGQVGSDGIFFAMDGDGGISATSATSRDYAVFKGTGASTAPTLLTTNNTTFGPAPLAGQQFDNANTGFTTLFPSQSITGYPSTPAGACGLQWIAVEVRQQQKLITWLLNNTIVAQFTNTTAYTNGSIMVGYDDPFASIGDPNNFAIIDNLRVDPIYTAVTITSPAVSNNTFSFSFPTGATQTYTVQCNNTVSANSWTACSSVSGTGAIAQFSIPVTNVMQYFRVIQP
jgi:hypothetical protein